MNKKPKAFFDDDTDTGYYLDTTKKERVRRVQIKWIDKMLNKMLGVKYRPIYKIKIASKGKEISL